MLTSGCEAVRENEAISTVKRAQSSGCTHGCIRGYTHARMWGERACKVGKDCRFACNFTKAVNPYVSYELARCPHSSLEASVVA